jgi:hypothetical protein
MKLNRTQTGIIVVCSIMTAAVSIHDLFFSRERATAALPLIFITMMWIGVYLGKGKKSPD